MCGFAPLACHWFCFLSDVFELLLKFRQLAFWKGNAKQQPLCFYFILFWKFAFHFFRFKNKTQNACPGTGKLTFGLLMLLKTIKKMKKRAFFCNTFYVTSFEQKKRITLFSYLSNCLEKKKGFSFLKSAWREKKAHVLVLGETKWNTRIQQLQQRTNTFFCLIFFLKRKSQNAGCFFGCFCFKALSRRHQ